MLIVTQPYCQDLNNMYFLAAYLEVHDNIICFMTNIRRTMGETKQNFPSQHDAI